MRRIAVAVAGAAIMVTGTVAFVAHGSVRSVTSDPTITLTAVNETPTNAPPNDVLRYWGTIRNSTDPDLGSYRATCLALGGLDESRLTCTIVLAFEHNASTMILQGLVMKPKSGNDLFESMSERNVVVTGGTADYKQMQGYADLQGGDKIVVTLTPTFSPAS